MCLHLRIYYLRKTSAVQSVWNEQQIGIGEACKSCNQKDLKNRSIMSLRKKIDDIQLNKTHLKIFYKL